jgi:hypothetical protein
MMFAERRVWARDIEWTMVVVGQLGAEGCEEEEAEARSVGREAQPWR